MALGLAQPDARLAVPWPEMLDRPAPQVWAALALPTHAGRLARECPGCYNAVRMPLPWGCHAGRRHPCTPRVRFERDRV